MRQHRARWDTKLLPWEDQTMVENPHTQLYTSRTVIFIVRSPVYRVPTSEFQ